MIAALFVEEHGCYYGLEGVEPWDVERDARAYPGPWPVVAHPPCERWGRYWSGGPSAHERRKLGDDGGCFASALASVRRFGGVLEHPHGSHAWRAYGLSIPPYAGGWIPADGEIGSPIGWTCCVDQGGYGHRARKATWLYAVRVTLPSLTWRSPHEHVRFDSGYHSPEERKARYRGPTERLSHKQRLSTPLAFRDLLLSIARSTGKAPP